MLAWGGNKTERKNQEKKSVSIFEHRDWNKKQDWGVCFGSLPGLGYQGSGPLPLCKQGWRRAYLLLIRMSRQTPGVLISGCERPAEANQGLAFNRWAWQTEMPTVTQRTVAERTHSGHMARRLEALLIKSDSPKVTSVCLYSWPLYNLIIS